MSTDFKSRREPSDLSATNAKVRSIGKPVDPMATGLPANVAAEQLVLGSILLNDDVYLQVAAALELADFSLEKHRRIFARMNDVQQRGEHIDRVTLADELIKQGQLESVDGLSYLISLDEGLPTIPHLDSYIRIVKEKATLRKIIFNAQATMNACLLETGAPQEILNSHLVQIEQLRSACTTDRRQLRRVEDLESIFASRMSLEYLIEPELPAKAIVCLTGDSESGKTTLACAWGRIALSRGNAVLILDRDKNPRDRICDRLVHPGAESTWVMRVILSPCRRIGRSNQCGSSDRGRRIWDGWRNG